MLTKPITKIELSVNSEFSSYARDESTKSAYFNCSLKAPICPDEARKPVDIVVVLDRSGSMSGSKLDLCKKTIQFLMGEMSPHDRLGLVTYDTHVKTEFSLLNMDEQGKEIVERITEKIQAGSMTNLSGGLMAGIQEVQKKSSLGKSWFGQKGQQPNPVRSVLLLTDGLANSGITDTEKILEMMKGTLEPNVNVFTFGYGSDHNEDMLRKISEMGKGVYYFVQSVDGVSLAFADCLGGLLSVVAQNIKLECFGRNGCKIESIKTRKPTNAIVPSMHYEIELGDLYAEETRDVLIEVSMPALNEENKEFVVLEAKLNYANVLDSSLDEVESCGMVQRLKMVPTDQTPKSHITQQRNRIITAEALEAANAKAEQGNLDEGKMVLQAAIDNLIGSIKLLSTEEKDFSTELVEDLKECQESLNSRSMYHQRGKQRMKAKLQSHWLQRSNDVEVAEADLLDGTRSIAGLSSGAKCFRGQVRSSKNGYRNSKKKAMMMKTYKH